MKQTVIKISVTTSVIYTAMMMGISSLAADDRVLSRNYYEALIKQAAERRWNMYVLPRCSIAWKGFTDNQCDNSLAAVVWGTNKFPLQDIFLLSRLSYQSKIHIDRAPKTAGNVILPLPLPFERPIASTVAFGNYGSDQYIGLVADTDLLVYMEDKQCGADVGISHQWKIGKDQKLALEVGLNVPVKSVEHIMRIGFDLGKLFNEVFTPDITARENTLDEFYDDFIDVQSFFEQGVLGSKNLGFKAINRDLGIGDINIYLAFDFSGYVDHFDGLQCGINLIFPSGRSQSLDQLWPIELGNGGTYQCDIFGNLLLRSPSSLVNPIVNVAVQLSASHHSSYRMAQLVEQDGTEQVRNNLGIANTISRFDSYYVDAFSEYDTKIAQFADSVVRAQTKKGYSVLIGLGNYFYEVFRTNFSIGLLYQYMHKNPDTISLSKQNKQFDNRSLELQSNCSSHTASWNARYKFDNFFEIAFGSQHVIGGKNVPQTHELFGSLVWVF